MQNVYYENKSAPFHISVTNFLTTDPHLHKELELIYVFKGHTTAFSDRKSYNLEAGDLFLCFPNQIHYYMDTVMGEYMLIIPNADILFGLKDMLYDNIPTSNVLKIKNGSEIVDILKKSNSIEGEFKYTIAAGLLNQLFGLILPEFKLKPRIKANNSTLKDILRYCTHNFAENITLDDVADSIHMSKYHISHLFNEKLGMNFNSYINMLRINKACDLLEDTEKKIADISEETGFGSIRSFNRAFLHTMNVSPLKYRKNYRDQNF